MLKSAFFVFALAGAIAAASCGQPAPHPYPAAAKAQFNASCPPGDAVCECTWDQITREMSYEDYQAAVETFRTDGTMDPRITRARTHCIEHQHT